MDVVTDFYNKYYDFIKIFRSRNLRNLSTETSMKKVDEALKAFIKVVEAEKTEYIDSNIIYNLIFLSKRYIKLTGEPQRLLDKKILFASITEHLNNEYLVKLFENHQKNSQKR